MNVQADIRKSSHNAPCFRPRQRLSLTEWAAHRPGGAFWLLTLARYVCALHVVVHRIITTTTWKAPGSSLAKSVAESRTTHYCYEPLVSVVASAPIMYYCMCCLTSKRSRRPSARAAKPASAREYTAIRWGSSQGAQRMTTTSNDVRGAIGGGGGQESQRRLGYNDHQTTSSRRSKPPTNGSTKTIPVTICSRDSNVADGCKTMG